MFFFFFKQKTAYEMCGRDWSSDVCSSDLPPCLHYSLLISPSLLPTIPPLICSPLFLCCSSLIRISISFPIHFSLPLSLTDPSLLFLPHLSLLLISPFLASRSLPSLLYQYPCPYCHKFDCVVFTLLYPVQTTTRACLNTGLLQRRCGHVTLLTDIVWRPRYLMTSFVAVSL